MWYLVHRRPSGTILAGVPHVVALIGAAAALVVFVLSWATNYPPTPSDKVVIKALFENPFLVAAVALLGTHIVNFDYLAYKVNLRRDKAAPLLYTERRADWEIIEKGYQSTFGSTVFFKFHKYSLKVAFGCMCVGLFLMQR